MKILSEHWIDLGDAGQHQAIAAGDCQSLFGQAHCVVWSVSVQVKGSAPIDLWPLLKLDVGMIPEVASWLLDEYDNHCKSVIEAIREQEYRDRQECDA